MKESEITEYLTLESFYKKLLSQYIITNVDIKKIDNLFDNSHLYFIEVKQEEKDSYQKSSNIESKYLYVRNDFNIQMLSKEELNYLNEMKNNNNYDFEFLKNTLKRVISSSNDTNQTNPQFYGPLDMKYSANNTDLVIGFRYDHFSNEEELKEKWENNYYKQLKFIEKVLPKIEQELSRLLEMSVKIIEYNDYSVTLSNETKSK